MSPITSPRLEGGEEEVVGEVVEEVEEVEQVGVVGVDEVEVLETQLEHLALVVDGEHDAEAKRVMAEALVAKIESKAMRQRGAVFDRALARCREYWMTRRGGEAVERALRVWAEELVRQEVELGQECVEVAGTCESIALFLIVRGELWRAAAYYERARKVEEVVLGEHDVRLVKLYARMGEMYRRLGELSEAVELQKAALAAAEACEELTPAQVAEQHSIMAALLKANGDEDGALEHLQRAYDQLGGPDAQHSHALGRVCSELGEMHLKRGEFEESARVFQHALDVVEASVGKGHAVGVGSVCIGLGMALRQQGDVEHAIPMYERAIAASDEVLGEHDPRAARLCVNLAAMYREVGESESARRWYEQALERGGDNASSDNVAQIYIGLGELAEGEERLQCLTRAVQELERSELDEHQRRLAVADVQALLGATYADISRRDDALREFEACLSTRQALLPANSQLIADVCVDVGMLHSSSGALDKALSWLKRGLKLRESNPDAQPVGDTCLEISHVLALQEQHEQAMSWAKRALQLRTSSSGPDSLEVGQVLVHLAHLHSALGAHGEGQRLLERCLSIREERLGPTHSQVAAVCVRLGILYSERGRSDEALPWYERAINIEEQRHDRDEAPKTCNMIAVTLVGLGQLDRALEMYERALQYDCSDELLASTYNMIGQLTVERGDNDEARGWFERALSLAEQSLGEKHALLARVCDNLALIDSADFDKAHALWLRALGMLDDESLEAAAIYASLGHLCADHGRAEEALTWHERCVSIRECEVPDSLLLAEAHMNIGMLLHSSPQLDRPLHEALRPLEAALDTRERLLGPDDPSVGHVLLYIAMLYRDFGGDEHPRLALDTFQRCLSILEHARPRDVMQLGRICGDVGELLVQQGEAEQALSYFERSLGLLEDCVGSTHPAIASTCANIAAVHLSRQDAGHSAQWLQRAVTAALDSDEPDEALLEQASLDLADALVELGQLDEARSHYARCLALREKRPGASVDSVCVKLGALESQCGNTDAAIGWLTRVEAGEAFGNACLSLGLALHEESRVEEAKAWLFRALEELDSEQGPHDPALGEAYLNVANLVRDSGDLAAARPLYERALELREAEHGASSAAVGDVCSILGRLLADSDAEAAIPLLERAVRIREAQGTADADECLLLTGLLEQGGHIKRASVHCRRGLELMKAALGDGDVDVEVGRTSTRLGLLHLQLHDQAELALGHEHPDAEAALEEAAACFQESLAVFRATGHEHDDEGGMAFMRVAQVLAKRGQAERAIEFYSHVSAQQEARLGPLHPEVGRTCEEIGELLLQQGHEEHAVEWIERGLHCLAEANADGLGDDMERFGLLLKKLKRRKPAIAWLRRALAHKEAEAGETLDVARILNNLGNLSVQLERLDDASLYYERSLRIKEHLLGPSHLDVASSFNNIGVLREMQGELAEALTWYHSALNLRESSLPPDDKAVLKTCKNIADVLYKQGRQRASDAWYARANGE